MVGELLEFSKKLADGIPNAAVKAALRKRQEIFGRIFQSCLAERMINGKYKRWQKMDRPSNELSSRCVVENRVLFRKTSTDSEDRGPQ